MPSRFATDVFKSDDESDNAFRFDSGSGNMLEKFKNNISDRYKSIRAKNDVTTDPEESSPTEGYTKSSYGKDHPMNKAFINDISYENDHDYKLTATDGSYIDNSRDYSIDQRYYGGSNRKFVYKGGKNESRLYDSPVSMATMGGYYDVDDSPAASAAFLDRYIDQNNLNQRESDKYYKNNGTFNYGSDESRAFNPEEMMNRIDRGAAKSWKRAGQEEAELFGDIWGKEPPKWNMPQPPEKIDEEDQVDVDDLLDEIED